MKQTASPQSKPSPMRKVATVCSFSLLLTPSVIAAAEDPAPLIGDVITVDEAIWVEAASRRRQRIATAPQPVIVLDGPDLVSTPAVSLPDRLRYLPGIDVYQYRHGQHDVGMRGYNSVGNSRILVQADGLDLRWEGLGQTLWNGSIGSSELERIEIAKGPSSVTYGANAFGGALLLRTREAGDSHEAIIQGDIGDPFRLDVDATALGPWGKHFDYKITSGYTKLDDLPGITNPTAYTAHPRSASSGDTDTEVTRVAGEVGWRIAEDTRLSAGYRYVVFDEWEMVDDVDVGSNHTDWAFHTADLRLSLPFGEILYARQWADYFYSNQKILYGGATAFPDFRYTQAGFEDIRDTIRAQANLTFSDHLLTIGSEYVHYQSDSNLWAAGGSALDESSWEKVSTDNIALFAEDQWAVAPAWTLTGGLRVDDHSRVGTNTSPRLAVNYVPDTDRFVLLSVSRGYRLPNFLESEIQEYYFASDPDLNAETITAVEIEWSQRFRDFGLQCSINGFWNRSDDLVWTRPLDGATMQANYNAWLGTGPDLTKQPGPFFQFSNLDNPVTVFGTELALREEFDGSPFALWSNATWQRYSHDEKIRYQSDGFIDVGNVFGQGFGATVFQMDSSLPSDINAPPEWKFNVGCDMTIGRFFSTAAVRYVSSRTVFSFAYSSFSTGTLSVQEVDGYTAFDLAIGWEFGTPGTRTCYARLGIMDLFDSAHNEWYQATEAQLTSSREQQLVGDIGRQVVGEVRWTF